MKSVVAWEVLKPVSHRGVIELPGPLWPSYCIRCLGSFPLPNRVHLTPFAPLSMLVSGRGRSVSHPTLDVA